MPILAKLRPDPVREPLPPPIPTPRTPPRALFLTTIIGWGMISTPLNAHADDVKNLVSVAKELRGEIVQIVVPLQNGMASVGSGFWINR
jgi:hypothetical protein